MARTFIVSDRHNTFFTENNIKVGTQIPTEGTYRKGDIVVNIGNNTANEAMWICVEAGTPGTWEVVGAGAGGGSSLVVLNESVFVNEPVNEISLGSLVGKISNNDKLIVHHNSIHLMEGVDYEIDSEGTKIVKLTEGSWNESGEDNSLFSFELLKNVKSVNGNEMVVDTKLTSMVNNVIVNTPTTEVEIGIDGFNKDNDTLLVFKNGVIMVEGVEYNVSGDNTKIISINEVWNESNVENYGITFVVFKEVVIYNGENGSITMDMLGNDVKDTINGLITITELNAGNIDKNIEAINKIDLSNYATKEDLENVDVDLSPYQEKNDEGLVTTDKTIVGAINELFQSANNGKELIANAIGEPLNSEDTFSAMSNDINSLLSTFKTNMMNNGITVESGDKFKALIDKIATMVEEGEGKGIQIINGSVTNYPSNTDTRTFDFYVSEISDTTYSQDVVYCTIDEGIVPQMFTNNIVAVSRTGDDTFTETRLLLIYTGNRHYILSSTNRTLVNPYYEVDGQQVYLDFDGFIDYVKYPENYDFNMYFSNMYSVGDQIFIKPEINNSEITIPYIPEAVFYNSAYGYEEEYRIISNEYYIIGVGEEDTTLRDSLASILQEEGVSVTEEDDMASLISKVDSEFTNDNNTISGLNNQLVGKDNTINSLNSQISNAKTDLVEVLSNGNVTCDTNQTLDTLISLIPNIKKPVKITNTTKMGSTVYTALSVSGSSIMDAIGNSYQGTVYATLPELPNNVSYGGLTVSGTFATAITCSHLWYVTITNVTTNTTIVNATSESYSNLNISSHAGTLGIFHVGDRIKIQVTIPSDSEPDEVSISNITFKYTIYEAE